MIRRRAASPDYKAGQLGFGGNWVDLNFGYSNWVRWTVRDKPSNIVTGMSGIGDVNFTFAGNDDPVGNNPIPTPLPAGLPLLIAGLGALAYLRRRKTA